MLSRNRPDPFKVVFDKHEASACFPYANLFDQPVSCIPEALTLIATVVSITGWQDVIRRVRTTFLNRHKVVLGKFGLPKTALMTAVGAASVPVVKTTFPIVLCKCGWQFSLASMTALRVSLVPFGMLAIILPLPSVHMIFVILPVNSMTRGNPLLVLRIMLATDSVSLLFMRLGVLLCLFQGIGTMRQVEVSIVIPLLAFIALTVRTRAISALRVQAVFSVAMLWEFRVKPKRLAGMAELEKTGQVQHSDLTFANSHEVCSQGGVSRRLFVPSD